MLTHEIWIENNMVRHEIFSQLWRLKIKQIVIFNLRYYEELSYAQISKLMPSYGYKKGNHPATLHSNYYKAVTRIHLGQELKLRGWCDA